MAKEEEDEGYIPDAALTLDEIKEKDTAMLADLIRNAKRVTFKNEQQAETFKGYCIHRGVLHVGLEMRPGMDPRLIDRIMTSKRIRIESRPYPFKTGDEAWKNGTYIYKDDQLAVFVSDVRPVIDRNTPLRPPVTAIGEELAKAEINDLFPLTGEKTAASVVHLVKPAEKFAVITNAPGV